MTQIKVERLKDGYLAKNTVSFKEALDAVIEYCKDNEIERPRNLVLAKGRRFRKVPGQWSDFVLYEGSGPGSFDAVILREGQ